MILLKKGINILFFILLLFTFQSCYIFNKGSKNNVDKTNKEITKLNDEINKNSLKYKSLTISFSGNYKEKNRKIPLKGLIKIEKNSFIWITLRPMFGIEAARVLITNDSIKLINKLNKEYFSEDFNYIKKKLGFELTYPMIESVLTGKIITVSAEEKLKNYALSKKENNYIFQQESKINNIFVKHILKINNDYLLTNNNLSSKNNAEQLNIEYKNFTAIDKKQFPNFINIDIQNKKTKGKAVLKYQNIKTDMPVSAKFIIPKNYKRIQF